MARWTADNIPAQNDRVAIVTGANTGIGFVTALELARAGATVIVASRTPSKGEAAVARIEAEGVRGATFLQLDLADLSSVRAFADTVLERYDRLDLLVNNAGVMMCPESTTADGFELQFGTNHLGHFALVGHLMERLAATPGSRVVNVSSMAHRQGRIDFADLHFRSRPYDRIAAYGQSKLANLLFTRELQSRFDAAGVDTIAVSAHPGWTATDLQRSVSLFRWLNPFVAMKPSQGALPTLFAATEPSLRGGEYIGPNGWFEVRGYPTRVGMTASAQDDAAARRLWEMSEQETGVTTA